MSDRRLHVACIAIQLKVSWLDVCKMDSSTPARRPHKFPAHTVKDRDLESRPFADSLQGPFVQASRTSYSTSGERQHHVTPFFAPPGPEPRSPRAAKNRTCFPTWEALS